MLTILCPSVIPDSASSSALIFKIVSQSFMDRGPAIEFLSAFPEEKEYLYPPLTYASACLWLELYCYVSR